LQYYNLTKVNKISNTIQHIYVRQLLPLCFE